MKNFSFLITLSLFFIVQSCFVIQKKSFPEILTAEFEIKTYDQNERGYEVFIVIKNFNKEAQIKGLVLKKRYFDPVQIHRMNEDEVFVEQYFPLSSQRILNFSEPQTDKRKDGIIFEIDATEIYQEVTFKLK